MSPGRWNKDWGHDPPDWGPRQARRSNKEYDIYYSHSRQIMDTDVEAEELAFLRALGTVLDPLHPPYSPIDYDAAVMVSRKVVVSEFQGYIGKGATSDIKVAQQNGIPVLVLRGQPGNYYLEELLRVEETPNGDWQRHFAKVYSKVKKDWGQFIEDLAIQNLHRDLTEVPVRSVERALRNKILQFFGDDDDRRTAEEVIMRMDDPAGGASLSDVAEYIEQLPQATIEAILKVLESVTYDEWGDFVRYMVEYAKKNAERQERCPNCGAIIPVKLGEMIGQCSECGGKVAFVARAVVGPEERRQIPRYLSPSGLVSTVNSRTGKKAEVIKE